MANKRLFEFNKGKTAKFWSIELKGTSLVVQFGRIGSAGQTRTKKLPSQHEAHTAFGKAVDQKLKKGYVEQGARRALDLVVPKLSIVEWKPAERPIKKPVTKFGGQPVWIDKPQWPLSREKPWPMRFIGQVALKPELFGRTRAKMAYLFAKIDEWPLVDWIVEIASSYPDQGANAVILQPGGKCLVEVDRSLDKGPTLYTEDGYPCEYTVRTKKEKDPMLLCEDDWDLLSERESSKCFHTTWGDKIGGIPCPIQGEQWPDQSNRWQLLVQLHASPREEFEIDISGMLYAFISKDGRQAVMLSRP